MAIGALKLYVTQVMLYMIWYNMLQVVQFLAYIALPQGPAILRHDFVHVLIDRLVQQF